jgi:hypothetical protein
MRKGFLIYEAMPKFSPESPYLRRPLVIYDFATAPFRILTYDEQNLILFFISVIERKEETGGGADCNNPVL